MEQEVAGLRDGAAGVAATSGSGASDNPNGHPDGDQFSEGPLGGAWYGRARNCGSVLQSTAWNTCFPDALLPIQLPANLILGASR